MYLILVLFFLSTAFANQEAMPNTNRFVGPFGNLAQSLQLPSPGSQGAANSILPYFPFQLPIVPTFENFAALFNNFTQSLSQPQSGQPNDSNVSPSPRLSFPANPIYTTLPFTDLNSTEFSWLLGNLSAIVNAGQTTNVENPKPETRFFGNSGGNVTYADLNFLTLPQLFNIIGRR